MKTKKNNRVQKSVCLILAFLMIAGTIISTLTMIAFGAEKEQSQKIQIEKRVVRENGSQDEIDPNNDNKKLEKGKEYDVEIRLINIPASKDNKYDIKLIESSMFSKYESISLTGNVIKITKAKYTGNNSSVNAMIGYNVSDDPSKEDIKYIQGNFDFTDYVLPNIPGSDDSSGGGSDDSSTKPHNNKEEPVVTIRKIYDNHSSREARKITKGGRYDIYLHVEKISDSAIDDDTIINTMLGGAFTMDERSSIEAKPNKDNNIDKNDNIIGIDIRFYNVQYTGKGNSIDISLRYEINNTVYPSKFNISFDEYIFDEYKIPDIKPERPEIDSLTPGIYVKSYSVKGITESLPNPGDKITLEVVFENTSYDTELENIRMRIDTGSDFYIEDASSLYRKDFLDPNGTFKYVIDLKVGKDIQPKSHTVTFNFDFQYLTVNDARTSGSSTETIAIPIKVGEGAVEEDSKNPLVPHIIISEYSYGGDSVTAGDNFNLTISCKNTSSQYDLENIVMKIATPQAFSIASSSNSFYIEKLPKNSTFTKEIEIKAKPDAVPESHNLEISFDFQYVASSERRDGNSKETIAVPVVQIDRFTVQKLDMPSMLWQGDEVPISINLINKGKSQVGNVTIDFETEDGSIKESQYVGNVESGKEISGDFFITAGTPGNLKGKFTVSYEDSNLNIKTIEKEFNVEIQGMEYDEPVEPFEPVMPDMQAIEQAQKEAAKKKNLRNGMLIACGLVMAGVSAYTTVAKIKQQRSEESDENF